MKKRIHRWKLLIEEYGYTLKHIDGKANAEADALLSHLFKITSKYIDQNVLPELPNNFGKNRGYVELTFEEKVKLIQSLHINLIHPGIYVMENTLKRYLAIEGLRKVISKVCDDCLLCKTEKTENTKYGIPKIFF